MGFVNGKKGSLKLPDHFQKSRRPEAFGSHIQDLITPVAVCSIRRSTSPGLKELLMKEAGIPKSC